MGFGTIFRIGPNRAPTVQCPAASTFPCSPAGGFLVVHYHYSRANQLTSLMHKYGRQVQAEFRARWGVD